MSKSRRDLKKVKGDVYAIIRLVSDAYGIKIPKKDMPRVEVVNQGSILTAYNPYKNLIRLGSNHVDDGGAYAAEAGHFLRYYAAGRIGKPNEGLEEKKVDEFFDMATQIVSLELVKQTPLIRLFKRKKTFGVGARDVADRIRKSRQEYNQSVAENNETDQSRRLIFPNEISLRKRMLDMDKTYVGYAYAQQYSPGELLEVKDLYSLPDEEVKKRFFKYHRKGRGLEGRVLGFIGIASLLAGFFLLVFNFSKITGFSVFNTNYKSYSISLSLLLILFGAFLFFYSRYKGRT
ncbi:MAG: hypothetical protein WC796_01795 [Candidatus Pacearchaeota archaeon]|jgi:hypothetical protein